MPAAWVRHCVAKKMASCSSIGSAPNDRRWNNWSGVARGFVMCDMMRGGGLFLVGTLYSEDCESMNWELELQRERS